MVTPFLFYHNGTKKFIQKARSQECKGFVIFDCLNFMAFMVKYLAPPRNPISGSESKNAGSGVRMPILRNFSFWGVFPAVCLHQKPIIQYPLRNPNPINPTKTRWFNIQILKKPITLNKKSFNASGNRGHLIFRSPSGGSFTTDTTVYL